MNEARVFADEFQTSFASATELLEFLAERAKNSKWIRRPTKALRLWPLAKEADSLSGTTATGNLQEIVDDTEKNIQLALKVKDETFPVRDCAIQTILSRAGVSGPGLRKLDTPQYAKVVNYCLQVAKGDALVKVADGKVSAVHGGDAYDYQVLDIRKSNKLYCWTLLKRNIVLYWIKTSKDVRAIIIGYTSRTHISNIVAQKNTVVFVKISFV